MCFSKSPFPAEFHAQTAVGSGDQAASASEGSPGPNRKKIALTTHESAIRIIDKTGPLHNPADRDHCLQYMVAIGLLFRETRRGSLRRRHGPGPAPWMRLRAKNGGGRRVALQPRISGAGQNASIANAGAGVFQGWQFDSQNRSGISGGAHRRRRRWKACPLLMNKFKSSLASRLPAHRVEHILNVCHDPARLEALPVNEFMDHFRQSEKENYAIKIGRQMDHHQPALPVASERRRPARFGGEGARLLLWRTALWAD